MQVVTTRRVAMFATEVQLRRLRSSHPQASKPTETFPSHYKRAQFLPLLKKKCWARQVLAFKLQTHL